MLTEHVEALDDSYTFAFISNYLLQDNLRSFLNDNSIKSIDVQTVELSAEFVKIEVSVSPSI